jgi:hypothetical protein
MGFTPADLTLRYEQNRAIKDMEARLTNRRNHIINSLFMSYKLKDRGRTRSIMQWVMHWNKSKPGKRWPIDPDTIFRSAKTRAEYDARTVGGIAVSKRLHYLHKELRFSERPNQ